MSELIQVRLTNHVETPIRNRRALLINAGLSKHGYYYPAEVLRQCAHKFENAPFFLDHRLLERGVKDVVGIFKNVRWDDTYEGITGELHVYKHKQDELALIEELNNSGLDVGLSAVFVATYTRDQNATKGDSPTYLINDIVEVESVDFVLKPATLGRLLNSRKVNSFPSPEISEGQGVEEAMEPIKEPTPKEVLNRSAHQEASSERTVLNQLLQENQRLKEEQLQLIRNQNLLLTKNLLLQYELDESIQEMVLKEVQNATRALTEEEVEAILQRHNHVYDRLRKRVLEQEYPALVKNESTDLLIKAIQGTFNDFRSVDGVPPLRSLRQLWAMTTGDYELTGQLVDRRRLSQFLNACNQLPNTPRALIANSVTLADWAIAFGNLMYRQLVREYNGEIDLMRYRDLVRIVPANDFRPRIRVRIGGYPNLPIVNEAQNYLPLGSPTEENIQYAVSKRGGTEEITWEAIVNDDIGAIARLPRKLAFAAARTVFEFVMSFLFDNPTIYDGQPLFSSNHPVPTPQGTVSENNALTFSANTGITYKDIIRARVAQRLFREMNSGKPAGIIPKYIVAGPQYEEFIYFITHNQALPATRGATSENRDVFSTDGGARTSFTTDENIVRTFALEGIINPFTDNENDIFLVADPRRFETIEMAFLGSEEPELFVQDLPNVGTYFFADKITYKIRHVYGGAVIDFRSFVRLRRT